MPRLSRRDKEAMWGCLFLVALLLAIAAFLLVYGAFVSPSMRIARLKHQLKVAEDAGDEAEANRIARRMHELEDWLREREERERRSGR
jgi:hypothetical protein